MRAALLLLFFFSGIMVSLDSFRRNAMPLASSHLLRRKLPFRLRMTENTATNLDKSVIFGENGEDFVWNSLRSDASKEAAEEPLLASFMHASVLSQPSLERSLAFHLANLLSSPAMISTQLQALFLEGLDNSESFRDSLRYDILAVLTRDPAVKSYTDVLLYFKGFHALQTHRVAHWLWTNGRKTLGKISAAFFHVFQLFISF
jgi:hypothetical protein